MEDKQVKFALMIQKKVTDGKVEFKMDSRNEGISDPEVILLVESWLEAVKDQAKNKIKKGMTFMGQK